jgi:hypothetical protein
MLPGQCTRANGYNCYNVTTLNLDICDAQILLFGSFFILAMTRLILAEGFSRWGVRGITLLPFLIILVVLSHISHLPSAIISKVL